jgi:outer membrane protein OmpA-like peptidoglycan-associated protein
MIAKSPSLPASFRIRCALVCVFALGVCLHLSAQSVARLIREGNDYFEHGKYRAALQYYKQAGNAQTWDGEIKLRAAICQYEINEIDGAIPLLGELIQAGKTDPEVYLYLARCYHHKNLFVQAVSYYKQFLRKFHDATPLREWVKDEVVRCANGLNLRYAVERAYVENMGAGINSLGDDYAPAPSPNYQERLYFTSAREGSEGGMLADDGSLDLKYGSYRSDIYYTEHDNGIWRSASALDHILNSRLNEEIFCFSSDGQEMYYRRNSPGHVGDLLIDTFSVASRVNVKGTVLGQFQPRLGDKDLFFYNDTIMMFASNKSGGYGGYDLYYSVKRKGKWRDAVNMGTAINSFYDDVSPFLARNGRVLYFSSNRLESIGGLDVFSAVFDDANARWSSLVNMGIPINSAGDDSDFCLSADGLKAYISSDRKTGYGSRDLFSIYFKEQVREHLALSVPITFIQLEPLPTALSETSLVTGIQEVREYVLSDLWFEPNDLVITPQNIKKLEILSNLLLIYPTLTLDLICHDVASGPKSYDLFFSVKKSEQVAQYLTRKGIASDRLYIKGCGAYYPIANIGGKELNNTSADRLNRRIELHIYGAEGQPVTITMEEPVIPDELRDYRGIRFDTLQHQLVYRVQIASVGQLLQHNVFDEYADAMVEYDSASRMYRYMIGMEILYKNAAVLRDALIKQGLTDAFVVAYVKGKRILSGEVSEYLDQYPDLVNFME